jgi:tetratricopeptide (TPR) repeat protein
MKFINALRTSLVGAVVIFALMSCSTSPEKNADTQQGDKKIGSPALPSGPVTPNPYLEDKPKVNAQTQRSFEAAVVAMQQKKWAQAETQLQALAVANPKLSGVQLNLGIVYRAKGDLPKATEAFNQAIKINSKNLDAYNQLAIVKREAGDFVAAEALYQKALAVWPFHAESHKNIAILYELYMGKPGQALPHFQAYQQLLPAPDKQVDSWIADLERRLGIVKKVAKPVPKEPEKNAQTTDGKGADEVKVESVESGAKKDTQPVEAK